MHFFLTLFQTQIQIQQTTTQIQLTLTMSNQQDNQVMMYECSLKNRDILLNQNQDPILSGKLLMVASSEIQLPTRRNFPTFMVIREKTQIHYWLKDNDRDLDEKLFIQYYRDLHSCFRCASYQSKTTRIQTEDNFWAGLLVLLKWDTLGEQSFGKKINKLIQLLENKKYQCVVNFINCVSIPCPHF